MFYKAPGFHAGTGLFFSGDSLYLILATVPAGSRLTMKWVDSLREAICRRCDHNGTDYFTREQLIQWELPTIICETGSTGRTPEQTLSRELQRFARFK